MHDFIFIKYPKIFQAFNEYYNNEHTRLLKMWKDVVAVKRLFKEMTTTTKMELGKMRCEIAGTNREVAGACSGVSVNIRNASKMDVSF
jgi:rootletin